MKNSPSVRRAIRCWRDLLRGRRVQRPARLRRPPPTGRYRYVRLRWRLLFAFIDWWGERFVRCRASMNGSQSHAAQSSSKPSAIEWHGQAATKAILLVQLDHLGDALMTAAVLPALKAHYPAAHIEVLASEWNRAVFEACPQVARVHVSRYNRFARGWRPGWLVATLLWGLRLRRRRFDLAIDVRGEFPLAAITWLCGARRRLGWDCGGGGFLLTDRAEFVPGRPEVESRVALLSSIGVDARAAVAERRPWFNPGDAARRQVARRLELVGKLNDVPHSTACCLLPTAYCRVVFHVGAGTPAKSWPAEHWRELLGRMIVEHAARVVLVGSRRDATFARRIMEGHDWPGVADWTGLLSLRETAALIEAADLFIGPDSGPAHLAAAVGTPAVVLFSGTNRVRQWRPWGRRVLSVKHHVPCSPCHRQRCPLPGHPCLTLLTPAAVMGRVRALWPASGFAHVEKAHRRHHAPA
jgi:lipopolysaccharide heptosyltransferase II